MKRTPMLIALALVAALTLAGCGNDNDTDADPATSSGNKFNDADVTFAQSMILHHRQAVEMAKMADQRASSTQVRELAKKIETAQGPEIDTMTGWLQDWGKDVPDKTKGMDGMSGMDQSGGDMTGMMSQSDMKDLDNATGAEFDRMFLTMMISHHSGAIKMAQTEQADGENPDAVKLAKKIEADQTAEITTMRNLLKS